MGTWLFAHSTCVNTVRRPLTANRAASTLLLLASTQYGVRGKQTVKEMQEMKDTDSVSERWRGHETEIESEGKTTEE